MVVLPRRWLYRLDGGYATWTAVVPLGRRCCYTDGGGATWKVVVLHGRQSSYGHPTSVCLQTHICLTSVSRATRLVCQLHYALFCTIYVHLSLYPYFSPYCKGVIHKTPKSIIQPIVTSYPCCPTPCQSVVYLALILWLSKHVFCPHSTTRAWSSWCRPVDYTLDGKVLLNYCSHLWSLNQGYSNPCVELELIQTVDASVKILEPHPLFSSLDLCNSVPSNMLILLFVRILVEVSTGPVNWQLVKQFDKSYVLNPSQPRNVYLFETSSYLFLSSFLFFSILLSIYLFIFLFLLFLHLPFF